MAKKLTRKQRTASQKNTATKNISEEEMKKQLEEEKMKRADICWREISIILQKYKCELNPAIQLTSNGNRFSIDIHAK